MLSIRLLLSVPNAEDGLVPDITDEYNNRHLEWLQKAKSLTKSVAINSPRTTKMEEDDKSAIDCETKRTILQLDDGNATPGEEITTKKQKLS